MTLFFFFPKVVKSKRCEILFECSLLLCPEGLSLILGGQEGGCCCIRLENWIGSCDSPKQFLTAIVLIQQDWTNNVISFQEKKGTCSSFLPLNILPPLE